MNKICDIKEYINTYYESKLATDESYTYQQAINDVRDIISEKNNKKILAFNKEIEYTYDANNMPKLIHFTLKDKKNINNDVWKQCLNEYQKMYPDYKFILYDNDDIYNIVSYFDKRNLHFVKNIKKGAILADVFRYLILYLRGGYYSDMDCFPYKRIEELSKTQYHGNDQNIFYIHNQQFDLNDKSYEFYENPCKHCQLMYYSNNNKNLKKIKQVYKCLGHQYIKKDTNIIVGYEFEKTWHQNLITGHDKHLWTHNNVGICQWFIGAKPNEPLFKKCYKKSLENIKQFNYNIDDNYHFNVINSTGPLFFTKMIHQFLETDTNFKNKIVILPCDYFCCGSGNTVPSTKNKFIQHKFTGSWLK